MIQKLLWHTELPAQLLGHILTDAKVFCVIDATSGQVRADIEASKLLTIVTNMGRFSFTVMPQGVCNRSALWNILTDFDSRKDSQLNILQNMDDFMQYGKDKLEQKLEKFMQFTEEKNLKKSNKFYISDEFGGSIVTVKKCKMRI